MTTPQPSDPVLGAAQADRDHVAALLAAHKKTCTTCACDTCACETGVSLQAHAARTERQLALLTAPETETEALF
jgi:hypothetical protein